jgi:large subunit ribosomal protein L6
MSRKGKIPLIIPKDVKIAIDGSKVNLEGPKGKLSLPIPAGIKVESKDAQLLVTRSSDIKQQRANHGTIRARLESMIIGVTKGHKRELEIQGTGFRATLQGDKILLNLGYSHPINFDVPKEVKVSVPSQTQITIEGTDNQIVGLVAAKIRDFKPVEPYKGKGIRYAGEVIKRKQGKSVTK